MDRITLPPVGRKLVAVLLAAVALSAVLGSLPAQSGPLSAAAPSTAEAASRQWWGIKLNWNETNAVANANLPRARDIIRGVGLGSIVNVLRLHHIEAARFSVWQGRCLGITWIGSAVPGQKC